MQSAAASARVRLSAVRDDFRVSIAGNPYAQMRKDKTPAGKRNVPIPKPLFDAMKAHLEESGGFGFDAREDGKGASDPVRKLLRAHLTAIGATGQGFTVHGLRKTLNNFLFHQGVDLEVRCQFIGHKIDHVNVGLYLERMIGAIFDDKPELLKAILKSAQDIQPWLIEFADEDLKVNPQTKLFSMFQLAKRCNAWRCIEMLAKIWADFEVEELLESTLVPAYEEYGELSDGDSRGAELEAFFKATNKGFANGVNGNFQSQEMIYPSYNVDHQRAATFILLDFSRHVLRSKKLSGAENARVTCLGLGMNTRSRWR